MIKHSTHLGNNSYKRWHSSLFRWESGFLLCLFMALGGAVGANDGSLMYGTVIKKSEVAWDTLQHELGTEFSPDPAFPIIMLPLDEKLVVWYIRQPPDDYAYLSFFEHGQEQVLHKSLDFCGPFACSSYRLAVGFLNQNTIPDLIVRPIEIIGVGKAAEQWKEYMRIFFDEKTVSISPVSLSWVDASFGTSPDDCEQPGACWEKWRSSRVMFLPAWGIHLKISAWQAFQEAGMPDLIQEQLKPLEAKIFAAKQNFFQEVQSHIGIEQMNIYQSLLLSQLESAPGDLYVWSQLFQNEQTTVKQNYQIEHYAIQNQQLTLLSAQGGNRQETANKLRTVLIQWKDSPKAPAPIFLGFEDSAEKNLNAEELWFQF